MDENKTPIGSKLRALRHRHGWSQQKVADMIQLSRTAYQSYEKGTREPSRATLQKLSEIFETPIGSLALDEVTLVETVRETSSYNRRKADEEELLKLARRMSFDQFKEFMIFGRQLVKNNKID